MEAALKTRLVTGAVLLALAVAVVAWAPAVVAQGFMGAVLLLAAHEWGQLRGQVFLTPLLAAAMVAVWLWTPSIGPLLVAGALWWLAALALVARGRVSWPRGAVAHAGMGAAVLLPAWAALDLLFAHPAGRGVVLGALTLVWAADSAAYFAGRRFGRRRLAPVISPGKSVEGAAAGVLAATAVGALLGAVVTGDALRWAALAMVAGAASVVGDLFESLAKRAAGVKDSGRLLPGHGGVLDRIDALTAALPVFALGTWLLT